MTEWINKYYSKAAVQDRIDRGEHRGIVGGLWDKIGQLQLDHMLSAGLEPHHRLLDLGCGCLRGGLRFVEYLQPGHYYGIDLSQDLLDIGYDLELRNAELQGRLPRSNLACTDVFDASGFGVGFDYIIAQSVFTHLPLNHLKYCLIQLQAVTKPGVRFYVTIFEVPEGQAWAEPFQHSQGKIVTYPERDPYHYQHKDLEHACLGSAWKLNDISDWNHPRNQKMATFTRL